MRIGDEVIHHRLGVRRGGQEIQVADRFLAAAQAAGGLGRAYLLRLAQPREQRLRQRPGLPDGNAVGAPGEGGDAREDPGLDARAHALHRAQAPILGGRLQARQVRDTQLFPEARGALRPHAADLQEIEQRRGNFLFFAFERRELTGGEDLFDLCGDGFAHAGEGAQFARCGDFCEIPAQPAQGLGRAVIGVDAEGALAPELEHRAQVVEELGDGAVIELHDCAWGMRVLCLPLRSPCDD
ncbi:MAG: hypothetical protein NTY23_02050 [Chloroflexi bacterium]|nr:hypothetical protein [Chloroflexota bacterium]